MKTERLTVQNVIDLPDSGKRWLQEVLGQDLRNNQQVLILLFTPGVEPDEATRRTAHAKVTQTMSQVEKTLADQDVTGDAFDAAVAETMADVRRRES